jgi:hypothetical protein
LERSAGRDAMTQVACSNCSAKLDASAKFCSECGERRIDPAEVGGQPLEKGKNVAATVLVIALVGIPVGLMLFALASGGAKGEIRSRGEPFGTYVQKPPACHSGEHESFFGVWVAPDIKTIDGRNGFQGGLKLLKNPLGEWTVFVESPLHCQGLKCPIRELEKKYCKVWDVDVRNTSTSVNDIRVREGHAKLDCSFPEGGSLTANLTFDGCT